MFRHLKDSQIVNIPPLSGSFGAEIAGAICRYIHYSPLKLKNTIVLKLLKLLVTRMPNKVAFLISIVALVAYDYATNNMPCDANVRPVITKDDEWRDETEWDEMFADLQNRQKTTNKGGFE